MFAKNCYRARIAYSLLVFNLLVIKSRKSFLKTDCKTYVLQMGVFRREICLGKVAMSRTGYACKGITKLCLSCDNVLRLCVFVCVCMRGLITCIC